VARILYFGRLAEIAGGGETNVALPADVDDTEKLRGWLSETHPALRDRSVRIAVNQIVAREPAAIADGDEIAFLPPVSGG